MKSCGRKTKSSSVSCAAKCWYQSGSGPARIKRCQKERTVSMAPGRNTFLHCEDAGIPGNDAACRVDGVFAFLRGGAVLVERGTAGEDEGACEVPTSSREALK